MRCVVTGCAGFIGSNLVDRLLADGHEVAGIDCFSSGRREFVANALKNPRFKLHEVDLYSTEPGTLAPLFSGAEWVFHLAANADVRRGLEHPRRDLEQNTLVTWNVLEAMRQASARRIVFSSTGSVYGEAKVIPTPEDCPFPIQTSLYGTSKLSCEGLISAYAEGYGFEGVIFRFVSILGERYTHGHVVDFVEQLRKDPSRLKVLGDGTQRKSYLYVGDCLNAMTHFTAQPLKAGARVYNLGTAEFVDVKRSIAVICDEMKISPKLEFTGGDRGWVGDNPFIWLECAKMRAESWAPTRSIEESVRLTVRDVLTR